MLASFAFVLVSACGPVPTDSGPAGSRRRDERSDAEAKRATGAAVERLAVSEGVGERDDGDSELSIEDGEATADDEKDEKDEDGEDEDSQDEDSQDDGNEVDEEETFTGNQAVLTVVGLRLDDDDDPQMIRLTRTDGKVFELQWPGKDAVVTVEGACDRRQVTLAVEVRYEGKTYTPAQANCFIGKSQGESGKFMGFEEDCSGGDYRSIDDAILVLACTRSRLELTGLTLNESIDLEDWRDH